MSKDSGQAFPVAPFTQPNGEFDWGKDGMSLRDYFAAAALQGDLASQCAETGEWQEAQFEKLAERMFKIAAAMIKERNK